MKKAPKGISWLPAQHLGPAHTRALTLVLLLRGKRLAHWRQSFPPLLPLRAAASLITPLLTTQLLSRLSPTPRTRRRRVRSLLARRRNGKRTGPPPPSPPLFAAPQGLIPNCCARVALSPACRMTRRTTRRRPRGPPDSAPTGCRPTTPPAAAPRTRRPTPTTTARRRSTPTCSRRTTTPPPPPPPMRRTRRGRTSSTTTTSSKRTRSDCGCRRPGICCDFSGASIGCQIWAGDLGNFVVDWRM